AGARPVTSPVQDGSGAHGPMAAATAVLAPTAPSESAIAARIRPLGERRPTARDAADPQRTDAARTADPIAQPPRTSSGKWGARAIRETPMARTRADAAAVARGRRRRRAISPQRETASWAWAEGKPNDSWRSSGTTSAEIQ